MVCEVKFGAKILPVYSPLKVILFFRSAAHAEVILENNDLQTNARNSKTI